MTRTPIYRHSPIYSIGALGRALRYEEHTLRVIADRAPRLYIGPTPLPKKNGGIRNVYDTRWPLKELLRTVNKVFFQRVDFPDYLTGSIKDRDYVGNAELHKNSLGTITEDISDFFPSIKSEAVYGIWRDFFKFGHEPAQLLTNLTTKDGIVFQGTPTSSYLANLVFWEVEPGVAAKLATKGIRYSRFVDDVTISSLSGLNQEEKRWAIALIYAMMGSRGFKPKRKKHEILSAGKPIRVMGLVTNSGVSLPRQERSVIRASVHNLEMRFDRGGIDSDFRIDFSKALGKVGKLKRFHKKEAIALHDRIRAMKSTVDETPIIADGRNISQPPGLHNANELPF